MPLITLLVYILIIALIWWLVMTYIVPLLPQPFRTIVVVVMVIITIVVLLSFIGVVPAVR